LTVTTYENLLKDRKTGKPPLMLGPMLLHQLCKERPLALTTSFFSNLAGRNKEVSLLLAFGTDAERGSTHPGVEQISLSCPKSQML